MVRQVYELRRPLGGRNKRVCDSPGWVVLGMLILSLSAFRIDPIPPEDRKDTKLFQIFFVWFSANVNILACVSYSGAAGASLTPGRLGLEPVLPVLRFSVSDCETRS